MGEANVIEEKLLHIELGARLKNWEELNANQISYFPLFINEIQGTCSNFSLAIGMTPFKDTLQVQNFIKAKLAELLLWKDGLGPKPNMIAINFLVRVVEVGIIICRDFRWDQYTEKYLVKQRAEFNPNWFWGPNPNRNPDRLNLNASPLVQELCFMLFTTCHKDFIELAGLLKKATF